MSNTTLVSSPSDSASRVERLRSEIEHRIPATLALLEEWVGINSYTANPTGVNTLGRRTARAFEEMGFKAEFVPHRDRGCGDHLVLTRRGSNSRRSVALVSHLDTVFPPEEEERNDFHWRPEGERIFGPGTIDIKGGSAMMHLVLSVLARAEPGIWDSVDWVLLWNASEETLSDDFANLARGRLDPATTLGALVFESEGRSQGKPALVVGRKGRATFRVTVEGRGAHAGVQPMRGVSAITQLARIIDRIAHLTEYQRSLTFNVGVVQGGTAVNRVPHLASAELEMRAFDPVAYRDGRRALEAMAGEGDLCSLADGHHCRVQVECLSESPPWPRNSGTDSLFDVWKSCANELRMELEPQERGGLSDGNWIQEHVRTLDGLGPYGDNDHCSERSSDGSKVPEFLWVPSLAPKALLNAVALLKLITERAH